MGFYPFVGYREGGRAVGSTARIQNEELRDRSDGKSCMLWCCSKTVREFTIVDLGARFLC